MAFGATRGGDPSRVDVSVVIPLYNHARYVGRTIESVLAQTRRPREIIVIDDGSTDGSASVVEAIAARDDAVRFWSRPNRGAHATLNEGIAAARGAYVAILNSDDLYHPSRLEQCVATLEADDRTSAVATGISFIDGDGRAIENPWYERACAFHQEVGDLGLALVNANFVMTTSNLVARRDFFEQVGPFDDLRYAHDLELLLRAVLCGRRIAFVRRPLLAYRMHGANTISEAHAGVRVEWAAVAAHYARGVAAGGGSERARFDRLRRLLEITDRHQLTRMVALVLMHLDLPGVARRRPGETLGDPALRAALREMA